MSLPADPMNDPVRSGVRTFLLLLLGLCVSQAGSQITAFGLGIWLYQRTGSVSLYSLVVGLSLAPLIVVGPLAGVLVDRWDRRNVLLLAQAGGGASSLLLVALYSLGALKISALLALVTLAASFNALEPPAVAAATTVLVPAAQRSRINGLAQLGTGLVRIVALAAGGFLLRAVGLRGILAVDVASFLVAIGLLAAARVPRPKISDAGRAARGPILHEVTYGFRHAFQRPGLLLLLLFAGAVNVNLGIVQVVFTPLVLSFSSVEVLGIINSLGGLGVLAGSGLMILWSGPRRRVDGALGFALLQGLLLLLAAARPSVLLAGAVAFGVLLSFPPMGVCAQTIWQRKVPADVQGRVFAAREATASAALAASCLLAGPLVDHLFEPSMAVGGALAPSLGPILGVGPGRGVALLLVVLGGLTLAGATIGYLHPRIRKLEDELPDEEVVLDADVAARSGGSKEASSCVGS
jgi:MFS transporter, DHA3 family, macrolide efflux protein